MLVSELKTVDLTIFIFLSDFYFIFYFILFFGLRIRGQHDITYQKTFLSSYHYLVWLALIGNSSILCVHYILSPLQASKV